MRQRLHPRQRGRGVRGVGVGLARELLERPRGGAERQRDLRLALRAVGQRAGQRAGVEDRAVGGKEPRGAQRARPPQRRQVRSQVAAVRERDQDRRHPADQVACDQERESLDLQRDVAGGVPRRVVRDERHPAQVEARVVGQLRPRGEVRVERDACQRLGVRQHRHGQRASHRGGAGDVVAVVVGQQDRVRLRSRDRAAAGDHREQHLQLGRIVAAGVDHDETGAAGHPDIGVGGGREGGGRDRVEPDAVRDLEAWRGGVGLVVGAQARGERGRRERRRGRGEAAEERRQRGRGGERPGLPARDGFLRRDEAQLLDLVGGGEAGRLGPGRHDGQQERAVVAQLHEGWRGSHADRVQVAGGDAHAGLLQQLARAAAREGAGIVRAVDRLDAPAGAGPVRREEARAARAQAEQQFPAGGAAPDHGDDRAVDRRRRDGGGDAVGEFAHAALRRRPAARRAPRRRPWRRRRRRRPSPPHRRAASPA